MDNTRRSNSVHGAHAGEGAIADPSQDAAIQELLKEVNQLLNPLAIGVTLGGLLLDVVVPRPKPRIGFTYESSLLSERADSRTPGYGMAAQGYESRPLAGGSLTGAVS